jgi:protein involved in polysaccharide export with SLBB domain
VTGGDVVVVPKAGYFIADGWLAKPGTYPVRSGLTLRGAIATAGGLTFPARTNLIRIHRPGPNGEVVMREVNYDDIVALRANDVFITEGDIVEVGYDVPKLVPYVFYRLVQDMVRVGAGIKVPVP